MHIRVGDEICADGICIESNDIEADESAMTGESDMMKKTSYKEAFDKMDKKFPNIKLNEKMEGQHVKVGSPMMISGTRISKGAGKYVAIAVGSNSTEGKISDKLKGKEEGETPLQEKLNFIANMISKFGG